MVLSWETLWNEMRHVVLKTPQDNHTPAPRLLMNSGEQMDQNKSGLDFIDSFPLKALCLKNGEHC